MVNVTHDCYHRWARLLHCFRMFGILQEGFRIVRGSCLGHMAHLFDDDDGGFLIQHLVDGDHHAHFHQSLDDFTGFHRHLVSKICHRNGFRYHHLMNHGFRWCVERMRTLIPVPVGLGFAFMTTPTLCQCSIATGFDATFLVLCICPVLVLACFLGTLVFRLGTFFCRRFMQSTFRKLTGLFCRCCSFCSFSGLFFQTLLYQSLLLLQLFCLQRHQIRMSPGFFLAQCNLLRRQHRLLESSARHCRRRCSFFNRFLRCRNFCHRYFCYRLNNLRHFRQRLDYCNRCLLLHWLGRHCLCRLADFFRLLRLRQVAAHENALLTHFNLNRTRLTRTVCLLDLGALLACQRNLVFWFLRTMLSTQVLQQRGLVLLSQLVILRGLIDASTFELLQKQLCWQI